MCLDLIRDLVFYHIKFNFNCMIRYLIGRWPKTCTKKSGMGHGDFKLVAVFGAWFGWQLLPLLILMASAVGAIVGIAMMVFKNHSREQAIPFGPYLAVAGWICLLWGNNIWQWYLAKLL